MYIYIYILCLCVQVLTIFFFRLSQLIHRAPWTRARMWTIQGHDAFENAQGHGGRHCPPLPQTMSYQKQRSAESGSTIDARSSEVG